MHIYIHFNRTAYWRHKVSALCVPFFAILSPNKLATLKFLRRQKNLPTKNTPDLGVSRQALSNGVLIFFLNRAVELKIRNLIA
jgi:hypothetical protein